MLLLKDRQIVTVKYYVKTWNIDKITAYENKHTFFFFKFLSSEAHISNTVNI